MPVSQASFARAATLITIYTMGALSTAASRPATSLCSSSTTLRPRCGSLDHLLLQQRSRGVAWMCRTALPSSQTIFQQSGPVLIGVGSSSPIPIYACGARALDDNIAKDKEQLVKRRRHRPRRRLHQPQRPRHGHHGGLKAHLKQLRRHRRRSRLPLQRCRLLFQRTTDTAERT